MHKCHLNNTTFNKFHVHVAQSVEHRTIDLRDVGSNPVVSKNYLFCIMSLSSRTLQVDWSYTSEIKHDVHPRYMYEYRCIEKMII